MNADLPLGNMTTAEKLVLMERLWDDLSRRPEEIPVPHWHGEALADRIAAVRAGRTAFQDWNETKQRLRSRVE